MQQEKVCVFEMMLTVTHILPLPPSLELCVLAGNNPLHCNAVRPGQQSGETTLWCYHGTLYSSMQIPQVSEDINRVLIGMVEEDEGERMLLADILTLCRDCTDEDDASREVDRLVSYIMGPEEDLEVSSGIKPV